MKKNVLVGVCGGIAGYKTCELVRLLVKSGYKVKVMMTPSAGQFVAPLTFQTLSQNPVYQNMFALIQEKSVEHIALAQWADLCVIAPLSASTLGKLACGICDNLLTTVVCALAQKTPVVLAPAMNDNMWKNPIVQDNTAKLKKIAGYLIVGPQKGELACGSYGEGRMAEPDAILEQIKKIR